MKLIKFLKNNKSGLHYFVFITLLWLSTAMAQVKNQYNVSTDRITPTTLREQLITNELGLQKSMIGVYQAADQVDLARAQLLPSINLHFSGSMGAADLMGQMTTLLPFLLPSNWYRLEENKTLALAEQSGFLSLALNTFNGGYSLLLFINSDQERLTELESQDQTLAKLENSYQNSFDLVGSNLISVRKYLRQSEALTIKQALMSELFTLRRLLNLKDNLLIDKIHLRESPKENLATLDFFNYLKSNGKMPPEMQQINYLIQATDSQKWNRTFAFLGGGSVGRSSQNDQFSWTGDVNLGFGIFPLLNMTEHQKEGLFIQKKQLEADGYKLITTTLESLKIEKERSSQLADAEWKANMAFQLEIDRLLRKQTTIYNVLLAEEELNRVKIQKWESNKNLDRWRLQLERISLEGEFEKIYDQFHTSLSKK